MLLPITEKKTQETLKIIGKKREKEKKKEKEAQVWLAYILPTHAWHWIWKNVHVSIASNVKKHIPRVILRNI